MTDKCRRRMNGRGEYITTEITLIVGGARKKKKKRRRPRERKKAPMSLRGVGDSCPRANDPFSLGRWAARSCVFFTLETSRHLIRAQLLDALSTNSL